MAIIATMSRFAGRERGKSGADVFRLQPIISMFQWVENAPGAPGGLVFSKEISLFPCSRL
jgi:hypothetical protein